ncbi:Gcd2p [Sugiyamaella lignohabitans]|uniref:Translation initiation factor eIF2B subunit delta n=1 Tax=Sugiyamaella lignohabitans TaxID=796027 RepID=A0A161HLC1_9ASCO|nr:Gcd2p [Sugiyamaella lignohabitans]ANB12828.1 Gcd2p [Sugiyamaella lignohabitans]
MSGTESTEKPLEAAATPSTIGTAAQESSNATPASSTAGATTSANSTSNTDTTATGTDSAAAGGAKLSAKELKALKKKEKQAKRAAQKEASGLPPRSDAGAAKSNTSTPNLAPVGSNQGTPRQSHQSHNTGSNTSNTSSGASGQSSGSGANKGDQAPLTVAQSIESNLPLFAHLEPSVPLNKAIASFPSAHVHHSILQLYLQYSTYKIIGSTARCRAMLEAFKDVISDYVTPEGTTLTRNLTSQLSIQIDFLKQARQLSIPMGNSIRWLKQEISKVSIDLTEQAAKEELIESISNFIRDRLDVADQVIMESAAQSINDGDVILTYACSNVVKQALIAAQKSNKKFRVIVVDSRPLFEGKALAKELVENGIHCTYVLINALPYVIQDVTTVFLGANAMFSNGQLYSRVGTAAIATSAQSHNIPVIVLCETIKFSDRVQLDSVAYNERAAANSLLSNISIDPENNVIASPIKDTIQPTNPLSILNILYDLTHQSAIKKVITEVGSLPASSVPVILREYRAT